MFSVEKDKINYIRDYCKSIAFDVLKAHIDSLSEDFYVTIKEIIAELYKIFNNYDKLEKCNAILYNLLFNMRVSKKNKNEIFDKFYTRFSATIISLRYSETYKLFVLRRLITYKLRIRVIDISSSFFRLFIEYL